MGCVRCIGYLTVIWERYGREPVAIAYGDFNNDGAIDLMVANAGTDDVSVLLRNPLV